jgi:peptide/nickel transport system substrate-binding protein
VQYFGEGMGVAGRLLAIVVAAAAAGLLLAASGSPRGTREGGTFRVAFAIGRLHTIDPALGDFPIAKHLLAPACATLVGYPDKPLPAGFRLAPDLAENEQAVSKDGKTYTFMIRKEARFSTGAAVTARAFAHALERILTPAMKSDLAGSFEDIVGARKMLAGKATTLAGAVARDRRLTLRLTKRVPDLLQQLPNLCAVPPNLPADPEGAKAPLPSAAPYYVAEYVPGVRLVLERNLYYRGQRPHHVDRFDVDLASDFGPGIDEVASGTVDTFWPGPMSEQAVGLARRYGVNRSQFFVVPGNTLRVFVINTSRPLFRNNVKLRQALNFAVDRKALVREAGPRGNSPTDQYLLPGTPGYRDERIYPLKGPDLRRARALAKGRTRSGKAVLYTVDNPGDVAQAQILQRNLKAIGLELEVRQFPATLYFEKLATPGEPFDLARVGFTDLTDPVYLHTLFADLPPKYKRLLDRAARLTGEERYRAYGELDVQISRDAAPMIPVAVGNQPTVVSTRVGCIVLNPLLDLTAVCLK